MKLKATENIFPQLIKAVRHISRKIEKNNLRT